MSAHVRKRALMRLALAKNTRPETAVAAWVLALKGYWYDARDARTEPDGSFTLPPRVGKGPPFRGPASMLRRGAR